MGESRDSDRLGWFPLAFDVPLMRLIGARPVDPGDPLGGLTFVVTENTLNAAGALHGGVLNAVLDLAAYFSVIHTLEPGQQAVTNTITASYLAGTELGERLLAKGSLLHRTRRLAFISSTVTSGDRLIATASVTKSIVSASA